MAPTSTCRTSVGVAVLGGYLYAVGGQDGVSCLNIVERYQSECLDPLLRHFPVLHHLLNNWASNNRIIFIGQESSNIQGGVAMDTNSKQPYTVCSMFNSSLPANGLASLCFSVQIKMSMREIKPTLPNLRVKYLSSFSSWPTWPAFLSECVSHSYWWS